MANPQSALYGLSFKKKLWYEKMLAESLESDSFL